MAGRPMIKMLLILLRPVLTCLLVCHFIDYIEQNIVLDALISESKEFMSGKVLRIAIVHVSINFL